MKSFEKVTRITKRNQEKISRLAALCRKHDGKSVKLYWNILRERRTSEYNDFFLHYGNDFVGYLGIFHFKQNEVEVTAMVHPKFRQQGIFNYLTKEMLFELEKRKIPSCLFACHQDLKTAVLVLESMGANCERSEYSMKLIERLPIPTELPTVELKPSGMEDVELLTKLDHLSFGTATEITYNRFVTSLNEPNRRTWLAYVNGEVIGKMHIRYDGKNAFIHDFCVIPEHQSKGYGSAILHKTLQYLAEHKKNLVFLDLHANNKNALKLYEKCGFKVISAYDFWRM